MNVDYQLNTVKPNAYQSITIYEDIVKCHGCGERIELEPEDAKYNEIECPNCYTTISLN